MNWAKAGERVKGLGRRLVGKIDPAHVTRAKELWGRAGVQQKRYAAGVLILLVALVWVWGRWGSVGEVNGRNISRDEYETYLKYKRIPLDQKERVAAELDRYLEREALAELIEDEGVLDERQIEVEVDEFRKQMLIARYFEQYLQDHVTDEAVRNFYASNQERYQAKKAHVAHILFRTNPKMSDAERQALLTRAQGIYSKAMAGEDFGKLAQAYSEDTLSAKRGGDLGWLEQGAIDPSFTGTVFKMSQGEISKPFPTPFGYHVVKVIETPQVVQQQYERVQGDIRYELRQRTKEEEMKRLMDDVDIVNRLK